MTEHRLDLTALAKALENGEHSIFSASGSHMYLHCAGSLIPNVLAKDDAGIDAAEGTVAHGVGETWLRDNKKPRHLIGTKVKVKQFEIEITHEMLDYVQRYVDWCWSAPGDHFVETKVYYDTITPIPKQGGTADHAACSFRKLIITDLKYGKGFRIYAKDNSQIMLYAYGFFCEWNWLYDFQEIVLRIAQPRLDHMDEHTVTRQELLDFAESCKPKMAAAWVPNAPRHPGPEQCRFCRVQGTCGAYAVYIASLTEGIYKNLEEEVKAEDVAALKERVDWIEPFHMRPVAELDLTQLSTLYMWRGSIERWFGHVGAEIARRVAHGDRPPFQKLVEARANRRYTNIEKAKKYLVLDLDLPIEEVVTEKLVTPAELERVLRRHGHTAEELPTLLAPVVHKPRGKPTLAPLSDRRPALTDVDESVYQDILSEIRETDDPETEEI